jgi:chorismate dehydratase
VHPLRLACVSFLNTKPLIAGLDADPSLELAFDVPSRLLDRLATRRADVALLPTIDYQALPDLRVIASGGIGCDGPTLTVRLFSHVPIRDVRSVACDTDSHTSVALARILFARHFRAAPSFVPLDQASGASDEAQLLIGDKVICDPPAGFEVQVDLGDAWKQMTGLPFVFAIWTARPGVELGELPGKLTQAREQGVRRAAEWVERYARPMGWPPDVALEYLTRYLRFEIGERQLEAIRMFHVLADELGLLSGPLQPLRCVPSPGRATAVTSKCRGAL